LQQVILFYNLGFLKNNFLILDAVAGPDGEDATLLPKPFEYFKTSTELSKEKRKIIIGLPDVRISFSLFILFSSNHTNRIMISVLYQPNIVHVGTILFIN